jgi:hypothetical protein
VREQKELSALERARELRAAAAADAEKDGSLGGGAGNLDA